MPKFPIWDDVTTFDGRPWRGKVDVVCGGFPCQDISAARTNNATNGKQMGLDGKDSGLWKEMARVIAEARPDIAWIENSPNLRTKGLHQVLQDLDEMGYNTKRCVIGSWFFGADHERERMWIFAYTDEAQRKRGGIPIRIQEKHPDFGCTNRGENKSTVERITNGFPGWMDQLRAIGNAQDPRVAALAWEILSEQRGL